MQLVTITQINFLEITREYIYKSHQLWDTENETFLVAFASANVSSV